MELIVGCYTAGDYEREAHERLLPSLARLGLAHEVRCVADRGSWIANGAGCQLFLRDVVAARPSDDVLFLDVDAVVHADPWPRLRAMGPADLGVHFLWDHELLTGTLWLPAGPRRAELLDRWSALNAQRPDVWDQRNLDGLLRADKTFRVARLPAELCCICDTTRRWKPGIVPVIEHFQASRKYRK